MNTVPYDRTPFEKKQRELYGVDEARRRYSVFQATNSASFTALFSAFAEFYDPECRCVRCECYRLWNNLPLLRCYCDNDCCKDESLADWKTPELSMPSLGEFYD
jgi:hypothetical protein